MTTAPLSSHPMTSAEELAKYLAGDPELMLRAATSAVRRECRWHVAPVETSVVEVDGSSVLMLPTMNLVELVSIIDKADNTKVADLTSVTASSSGIVVATATATSDQRWWQSRRGRLLVTFKHGFDSAPELETLIMAVAARAIETVTGATREQAGIYASTWATTGINLTDEERKLCGPWRLVNGA